MCWIQTNAQPVESRADLLANAPGVLTDAAAENESIEPTQNGGHRAQLASDTENEIVDGSHAPVAAA